MAGFTRDPANRAAQPRGTGWWASRGRWSRVLIVVAGVLVVAVVVGGVWNRAAAPDAADVTAPVSTTLLDEPPPSVPETSRPPVVPESSAPPVTTDGVPDCASFPGINPDDPNLLVTPPPVDSWTLIGGVAAPTAGLTGPAVTDPVRSCYAHTPAGALFAVTNYLAQMQARADDPAAQIALADAAMASGEARDTFKAIWEQQQSRTTADAGAGVSNTTNPPLFRGFHFTAYRADRAVIDLAYSVGTVQVAAKHQVVWEDGSWKFSAPDSGGFRTRILNDGIDPQYFTLWSAQ